MLSASRAARLALLGTGLLMAGATALAPAASAAPSGGSTIAAYSLAAPRVTAASGLVARAVVPAGAECPALDVADGKGQQAAVPMRERPRPQRTAPAFDAITVCSVAIPSGAVTASIHGRAIPARMPSRIDRLALLGDSGCRIASWGVQDCSDESAWPLARISAAVASDQPDAIIFNGDFFYREAACPAGQQSECGSSPPPVTGLPFTDSAYGWIADSLLPMAPMLAAAPMIVTRGNHEACYRAGNGFFYLFDPREGTSDTCAPVLSEGTLTAAPTVPTPTYAIDLAVAPDRTLRLAVVDSAGGNDVAVDAYAAVQRVAYERAARLTAPRSGRESWLLTHRPIFGIVSTDFAVPGLPFLEWGSADQQAASWGLLEPYQMVFSSHQHIAMAVQIPGQPGQLILGNAGTLLDPATGYPLPAAGPKAVPGQAYPAPSWAWVSDEFGYAIARPQADAGAWRLDMRDASGSTFARCGLRARSLYCASGS
ncbi:MAG: metallophosphoesterase [Actinomycetales bacterium]|nr:metallophosphoesterase [Actinomycetales bacterium]